MNEYAAWPSVIRHFPYATSLKPIQTSNSRDRNRVLAPYGALPGSKHAFPQETKVFLALPRSLR